MQQAIQLAILPAIKKLEMKIRIRNIKTIHIIHGGKI
jgi:hypothetical protein